MCTAVKVFDRYDAGKSDFTPSSLERPVRIAVLTRRHWDELKEDVSDRVWTLSGQIGHLLFENIAKAEPERYVAERRFYRELDGHTIGARIDCYDEKELTTWDYKETSVWKFILGDTAEWEAQLNVGRWCAPDVDVRKLRVLAKLKDWKIREAERRPDYPQCAIHIVPIEIWTDARVEQYIRDRIKAHIDGKDNPPVCTPEERWERGGTWAVMKRGRKSAVKLFDNDVEAREMVLTDAAYYLERRLPEPTRCLRYCPVNRFCDFYLSLGIGAQGELPLNGE